MNLPFAGIDPNVASLVQQNFPGTGIGGKAETGRQEFFDYLTREKEALGTPTGSPSLFGTIPQPGIRGIQENLDALHKTLSREKASGEKILFQLRDLFLALSNGNLENLSIDAKGLSDLKKILVKAGFDPDDVDEILSGLATGLGDGKIQMDDLMANLFGLDPETKQGAEEGQTLVESSALPFFQSILHDLGLTPEQVASIVFQADTGEKGIDLDEILDGLKTMEKQDHTPGDFFQTREKDRFFVRLFEQMGLDTAGTSGEEVILSLKDLISSLETLKQTISSRAFLDNGKQKISSGIPGETASSAGQAPASREDTSEWIRSLFEHLDARNKGRESLFPPIQVQDPFNANRTASKDGKTPSSFFDGKGTPGSDPDFKELESLFKGSPSNTTDRKTGQEKPFFEKMVSDPAKEGEKSSRLNPETGTDAKVLDSKLTLSRTRADIRNLPNYVAQQVGKSVVKAVNQGENTLKIQLKPPELGRLVMTIDHTGNSMKVSILTENQAAKDILAGHVAELKTVLTSSGISLDQFDVDMSSDFRQSMADARNSSRDSGRKNQGREKIGADATAGKNDLPDPGLVQEGTLHYVA